MPPLPVTSGFDAGRIALNMVLAVVWALVASVGFAGAIAIGLKVFSVLTPGFNEWEEMKKGNTSVSILWAAFVLAVAVVVVGVLLK
ncbi:MAG: DUF350 domain-containing protein [Chloroflexi bacterium]|nr:DUF350 domain-containing protein [Chloroflexota bacterium]